MHKLLPALIALVGISCTKERLPVAQPIEAWQPMLSEIRDYVVADEAKKWGVDTLLALAVSHVENWGGDTLARSISGARGVMQVMPTTWMGVFHKECGGSDLINMRQGACYGVLVLKHYLEKCHGRVPCALYRYGDQTDIYVKQVRNKQSFFIEVASSQ